MDPLLVDTRGPVTVLTLNRPEARNAMTRELALAIEAAVDAFEADAAQNVMVITGAGGSFCAGMDLEATLAGGLPLLDSEGAAEGMRPFAEKRDPTWRGR